MTSRSKYAQMVVPAAAKDRSNYFSFKTEVHILDRGQKYLYQQKDRSTYSSSRTEVPIAVKGQEYLFQRP